MNRNRMCATQSPHSVPHPMTGQWTALKLIGGDPDNIDGEEFLVEDWHDRVAGIHLKDMESSLYMIYSLRMLGVDPAPDEDVVYGHVHGRGVLVHNLELDEC